MVSGKSKGCTRTRRSITERSLIPVCTRALGLWVFLTAWAPHRFVATTTILDDGFDLPEKATAR